MKVSNRILEVGLGLVLALLLAACVPAPTPTAAPVSPAEAPVAKEVPGVTEDTLSCWA